VSTKGRIKFTVAGAHPQLYMLRDHLIKRGFALVSPDEDVDFVLQGGLTGAPETWRLDCPSSEIPVLLLSSDWVYSDRDLALGVRDKVPMREDDPILLPSSAEPTIASTLQYLQAENYFLRYTKTMVLRIFNIYGPDIKEGLIVDYLDCVCNVTPLPIYAPGYQTRTYLHQTDFLTIFDRMVQRFLEGTTGIFNVGSEEETSIKRLADSVWQLAYGPSTPVQVEKVRAPRSYRWWVLPDLTRTKAVTKWKAKVTLRTGLWEMLND